MNEGASPIVGEAPFAFPALWKNCIFATNQKPMPALLLATSYLPPIEYFAIIMHNGGVTIEMQETYLKQTYRNRCHIATSGGLLSLTVPVVKTNGNHTRSDEATISYHLPWNRTHWRSLEAAYNSSPYFLYYRDALEPLYCQHFEMLIDLNMRFLETLLAILKIQVPITFTTSYAPHDASGTDFRFDIHPKKPTCFCPASEYPRYSQVFDDQWGFLPNLSILDLLFNMGPDTSSYLKEFAFNYIKD